MAVINVDFSQKLGKIKPMHAVGQPPIKGGFHTLDLSHIEYLQKANIPFSRLHDVGGNYGGGRYVDIPNLFRNFDADVDDPESYDFAFTDALLKGLDDYDVKPIFRLGVTIENQHTIKAYHIYPPKDYDKWARICEHVIRHYNEGWADGFHYGIEYWEIWNEPDNGIPGQNQMWIGTNEQFFELYHVAATHLKKCFGDSIKIGGYGACSQYAIFFEPEKYGVNAPAIPFDETGKHRFDFLTGFFDYIKERGTPIDFFSWHSYRDINTTYEIALFYERFLNGIGYGHLETQLNEWNGPHDKIELGTSYASSQAAGMIIKMHETPTDILCYYDARIGETKYAGFFHPITHEPFATYYSFFAFGKLYKMGTQLKCEVDADNLYSLCATDGKKVGMLISNVSGADEVITTNLDGATVYLIDEDHLMTPVEYDSTSFEIKKNQVVYIEK